MRRRSAGFISLSLSLSLHARERERERGREEAPPPFARSSSLFFACGQRLLVVVSPSLPPSSVRAWARARVRPRQPSFSVAGRLSVRPCLSARGERLAEAVYDGWGERTGGRLSLPLSTLPPPVVVGFLKLSR